MNEVAFDLTATRARFGGDEELVRDVIQYYLEDAPEYLDRCREAFDRKDWETVGRCAHSLKSLAANFNAADAVQAAREVENITLAQSDPDRLLPDPQLDQPAGQKRLDEKIEAMDRLCRALRNALDDFASQA